MHRDRVSRMLSVAALIVSLVALVVAGRALWVQRDHRHEMEALGKLIRRSTESGRPILDLGPPGGGRPELDRGN